MKFLFIYSCKATASLWTPLYSWAQINFGISYISSVLKAQGHDTRLVVLGKHNRWRDSVRVLRTVTEEFGPHVLCLTAVASQYPFIRRVAAFAKAEWPDKFVILGGTHATLNPQDVVADCFDAICVGEGEQPMLELASQLEAAPHRRPHGIANLWIQAPDGTLEKNPIRPFRDDLDSVPFPDRSIWKPWMGPRRLREYSILAARGCQYNCTYCCNHALRKTAPGKYVRMRSPRNIIDELALLHAEDPAIPKSVHFEAEYITLSKTWFRDLCTELEAFNARIGNAMSYSCNFRVSPQSLNEDVLIALRRSGFRRIHVGLESGSERVRREILGRNDYSNRDFLQLVSNARTHGLRVSVFNMIGLPGETYDEHMETVQVNQLCQPDEHLTYIFFPYPGTDLYTAAVRQGFITGLVDPEIERARAVMDFPQFSRKQIQSAYTWFDYRVYRGTKPLWLWRRPI